MSFQTVEIVAEDALNVINTVLPFVEKAIPLVAAAGGPIGLGVSAAAALIPLLEQIPTGSVITVSQQSALAARIAALPSLFSGREWQPRPVPAAGALAGGSVASGSPAK
jgi:hypothetical protein